MVWKQKSILCFSFSSGKLEHDNPFHLLNSTGKKTFSPLFPPIFGMHRSSEIFNKRMGTPIRQEKSTDFCGRTRTQIIWRGKLLFYENEANTKAISLLPFLPLLSCGRSSDEWYNMKQKGLGHFAPVQISSDFAMDSIDGFFQEILLLFGILYSDIYTVDIC
jgi:hypothetical protein